MRYRPLGSDGRSISALTLVVDEEPRRQSEQIKLVYAALESGINAFELRGTRMPETATGLGRALSTLPREALVVSLRLGPDPRQGYRPFTREWVIHAVERAIHHADIDRLDLLTLDLPSPDALDAETRGAAEAARDAQRIGLIGVAGDTAALDEALRWRALNVMTTAYNLRTGWADRNRLKAAASRGVVVIGADSYPPLATSAQAAGSSAPAGRGLFGLGKRPTPLEKIDGYAFLQRTQGWSPAELCLAYALTEPGLASVIVETTDAEILRGFATVPERDLPTGVPAQIEMARFSAA